MISKRQILFGAALILMIFFVYGCVSSNPQTPPETPEKQSNESTPPSSETSRSNGTGQQGGENPPGGSGGEGREAGSQEGATSEGGSEGASEGEEGDAGNDGIAGTSTEIHGGETRGQSGGEGPPGGPAPVDEASAALEAELGASLAEFDQKMREELQRLAAEAATIGGAGGPPPDKDSSGSNASSSESGGANEGETGTAGEEGDDDSGGAGGSSGEGGRQSSETPADVGDGSNDDIVARQLREAAQAEKDPELREKLWDEYRRYKASASGAN